jgi:hypothetical protein
MIVQIRLKAPGRIGGLTNTFFGMRMEIQWRVLRVLVVPQIPFRY